MSKIELIILGSGASAGVPAVTNWWGNCDPDNPKNRRTRPSIALISETTTVIVDTGPDFKEQYNRENLRGLDGIIYTHIHSDHTAGMDELRTFQRLMKRNFPIYADQPTLDVLLHRFDYMFKESENGFYHAVCLSNTVQPGQDIKIGDITMKSFAQDHGTIQSLGLRIGDIGYSTDMKRLGDDAITALSGIKIWLADAAGHHSESNPVHACVAEVIALNEKISAETVYLTHLPPTMDFDTIQKDLPDGFHVAYDGLRLETQL